MVVFRMNNEDKIHECGTVLIDMLREIDRLHEDYSEALKILRKEIDSIKETVDRINESL